MIINSYNTTRSIIALITILTFLFNSNYTLFGNEILSESILNISDINRYNLFYLFKENLIIGKLLAIFILVLVISGFFPRITGVLHAYVTYSFFICTDILDGGDHIASNLTILLIPLTLLDSSKNHWKKTSFLKLGNFDPSIIFYKLIILQVFFIYLHAWIGKIFIQEWINGTAVYYWFTHNVFGISDKLIPGMTYILSNKWITTSITWGTIIFEFIVSASIFWKQNDKRRYVLLFLGILFHFTILIVHGLFSFFFIMSACLIIYLLPYNKDFSLNLIRQSLRNMNLYKITKK